MTPSTSGTMALFGFSLEWTRMYFDRKLGMSNKDNLQNQLQNTCARNPEESNEAFDRMIRGWYCSITVSNHRLITVIRFVAKNYTHP